VGDFKNQTALAAVARVGEAASMPENLVPLSKGLAKTIDRYVSEAKAREVKWTLNANTL
jgi:hypothetical protein